jgi:mRNA interferase RelE/StbE
VSASSGYAVIIEDAAARAIRKLPRSLQTRIIARANALADDPRPPGCVKLVGHADLYRIRVSDYRIVYQIQDPRRSVVVLIVAHRREVYRGM